MPVAGAIAEAIAASVGASGQHPEELKATGQALEWTSGSVEQLALCTRRLAKVFQESSGELQGLYAEFCASMGFDEDPAEVPWSRQQRSVAEVTEFLLAWCEIGIAFADFAREMTGISASLCCEARQARVERTQRLDEAGRLQKAMAGSAVKEQQQSGWLSSGWDQRKELADGLRRDAHALALQACLEEATRNLEEAHQRDIQTFSSCLAQARRQQQLLFKQLSCLRPKWNGTLLARCLGGGRRQRVLAGLGPGPPRVGPDGENPFGDEMNPFREDLEEPSGHTAEEKPQVEVGGVQSRLAEDPPLYAEGPPDAPPDCGGAEREAHAADAGEQPSGQAAPGDPRQPTPDPPGDDVPRASGGAAAPEHDPGSSIAHAAEGRRASEEAGSQAVEAGAREARAEAGSRPAEAEAEGRGASADVDSQLAAASADADADVGADAEADADFDAEAEAEAAAEAEAREASAEASSRLIIAGEADVRAAPAWHSEAATAEAGSRPTVDPAHLEAEVSSEDALPHAPTTTEADSRPTANATHVEEAEVSPQDAALHPGSHERQDGSMIVGLVAGDSGEDGGDDGRVSEAMMAHEQPQGSSGDEDAERSPARAERPSG